MSETIIEDSGGLPTKVVVQVACVKHGPICDTGYTGLPSKKQMVELLLTAQIRHDRATPGGCKERIIAAGIKGCQPSSAPTPTPGSSLN